MQTQTSPAGPEFFLFVLVFDCFQSMLLFEQVHSLSHEVLVFFLTRTQGVGPGVEWEEIYYF